MVTSGALLNFAAKLERVMLKMSDLSEDEWQALRGFMHTGIIQQSNSQMVARLISLGALVEKKNGMHLSSDAQQLVVERMARIGRACNRRQRSLS
jgi:hypothetical protein